MKTLGILGGMGPFASAEFLRTIYDLNPADREQDTPRCLLLSDPSIPDRTEAILENSVAELDRRISDALRTLVSLGVDRIVIACVTAHHVLPRIEEDLRSRVISLLDLAVDEVLAAPRPYLLLTTTGSREARVFELAPRWKEIEEWVVRPEADEQRELHERLYRLKKEVGDEEILTWLEAMAFHHKAGGVIFGCTELHLVHRTLSFHPGRLAGQRLVDPLLTVARSLPRLLAG